MKLVGLKTIAAVAVLLVSLAGVASASEGQPVGQAAQQTLEVAPDATVSLCVERGDVLVRGHEGREVRASAAGAARIDLRRPTNMLAGSGPAKTVEVSAADDRGVSGCSFSGSVALDVPRGSTVVVKTVLARVTVSGVAHARVETVSGEVSLQGVTRSAEASSANGDLSVRKSAGRVRLHTISASIEAAEVRPVEAADQFSAKTTSGDVTLTQIGHAQVEATTTSGHVELSGALARGGVYLLKAYSGGIKVTLPADASFRVDARVAHGEIVTDFPIKQSQGPQAESLLHGQHSTVRVSGVAGDNPQATLTLSSFSGTLQLRKAAAR
jgi:hypothetical protein